MENLKALINKPQQWLMGLIVLMVLPMHGYAGVIDNKVEYLMDNAILKQAQFDGKYLVLNCVIKPPTSIPEAEECGRRVGEYYGLLTILTREYAKQGVILVDPDQPPVDPYMNTPQGKAFSPCKVLTANLILSEYCTSGL